MLEDELSEERCIQIIEATFMIMTVAYKRAKNELVFEMHHQREL